jgi:maleylpyruvate isomerase
VTARSRRHDVGPTRAWGRTGTDRLLDLADRLDDMDLRGPSLLPGWTRAHVLAHVARNADALGRLVGWARTGVVDPMYADDQQRADEIEAGVGRGAQALRADLRTSAAALDDAFDSLDERAWAATVTNRQGQQMRATVLPWLRVREVWLHAVDLAAGSGLEDAPTELVDELVLDVTATLGRTDGCPAVTLRATDRDEPWSLGDAAADPPRVVTGPASELLLWLVGRSDGARLEVEPAAALPDLPPWL